MFIPLVHSIITNNTGADWEIPIRFYPLSDDIITTIYVFISLYLFGFMSVLFQNRKRNKQPSIKQDNNIKFLFLTILTLYIISQVAVLIQSGKLAGGSHWYTSGEKIYEGNVIFSLLGQFNNVGRLVLPAICMYFELIYDSKKYFKLHVTISCIILVIELLLVGNRIAFVYVGISHLIPFLYYKKYKYILISIFLLIPISALAIVWPVVRGLMWTEKMSNAHIEYVYQSAATVDMAFHDAVMTLTEGGNLLCKKRAPCSDCN
ncbi:hypothetical protein FACS189474_4260 [Bacteroidia bacterium]|nr:hypothetical protein FACS189474_4260 [Bacteroidia bacterium]